MWTDLSWIRQLGLSVEPGDDDELVLVLGAGRYTCVLEPGVLEQWLTRLRQLGTRGGTAWLPYRLCGKRSAWLRVASPDGIMADVQADWSPSGAAEARVSHFEPIADARITRPVGNLIQAVIISRDRLLTSK